jgi:hypothetical protein
MITAECKVAVFSQRKAQAQNAVAPPRRGTLIEICRVPPSGRDKSHAGPVFAPASSLKTSPPSLNVYYKTARTKQYHKETRALRTDTTVNNCAAAAPNYLIDT